MPRMSIKRNGFNLSNRHYFQEYDNQGRRVIGGRRGAGKVENEPVLTGFRARGSRGAPLVVTDAASRYDGGRSFPQKNGADVDVYDGMYQGPQFGVYRGAQAPRVGVYGGVEEENIYHDWDDNPHIYEEVLPADDQPHIYEEVLPADDQPHIYEEIPYGEPDIYENEMDREPTTRLIVGRHYPAAYYNSPYMSVELGGDIRLSFYSSGRPEGMN